MKHRLNALRRAMRRDGLSAIAVTKMENVRYLSGFTGSAGACLVSMRGAVFITDFRYRSQAAKEVSSHYRRVEHSSPMEGIVREARRTKGSALAFEAEHLTHGALGRMRRSSMGCA